MEALTMDAVHRARREHFERTGTYPAEVRINSVDMQRLAGTVSQLFEPDIEISPLFKIGMIGVMRHYDQPLDWFADDGVPLGEVRFI